MVFALGACGPEVGEATSRGEGAGQSETADDDSRGTEDDGETEADEAESTELPLNDVLGRGTTITIENTSDAVRYLSPFSSFSCNYGQLQILIDGQPVLWDHAEAYPERCTDCGFGCSDGGTEGLVLAPGASAEIAWNGGYWGLETLDDACGPEICEPQVSNPSLPQQCQALRAMEAVEYTARVHVFDTCPAEFDQDACACPDGVCEAFFYEPVEGDYTVDATAVFPAGATIVLE